MSSRSRSCPKNRIKIVHNSRFPVLHYRYGVYNACRGHDRHGAVSISMQQRIDVIACEIVGPDQEDLDVSRIWIIDRVSGCWRFPQT
jgi:hypothetical protein